MTRTPPSWTTPHEIVFEAPIARLRDFSTSHTSGLVPTLVLPPQAGHDSCVVDYSAEQSQMQTILASGLERALSLDWFGATEETKDASIEDYLEVIHLAIEHCGGRVNLIGDCQGGWLATIYAALYPEQINTLTLAGAPIDFHAGEPVVHEVLRHLAPGGDLRFYEALVKADGGVLKGEHMVAGFMMIQPGAEISRQIDLLLHLDDEHHLARYEKFEDWFKHTQDVPPAVPTLGKRGAFEGVARRHGRRRNPARTTPRSSLRAPTNPPRHSPQAWCEKVGRSIKGSHTPHARR